MQIDPEYAQKLPSLTSKAGLDALQNFAVPGAGLLKEQRAAVVRQLAQRLRLAVLQAEELEKQIGYKLEDGEPDTPPAPEFRDHIGFHRQYQPGLRRR